MNSYRGPPMTLGNAAAAMVRLMRETRAGSTVGCNRDGEASEDFGGKTSVLHVSMRPACVYVSVRGPWL